MPDNADINLDELRRRARRRLIGAVVLALAAAVIVPMLLESEPKPLGEDVAVKIPPVDDAQSVIKVPDRAPNKAPSRVDPPKSEMHATDGPRVEPPKAENQKPDIPKVDTATATSAAPQPAATKKTLDDAEQKVLGGTKPPEKAGGKSSAVPPVASASQPVAAAPQTASPPAAVTPDATAAVAPSTATTAAQDPPAATASTPPTPKSETSSGGFSVQLAAFSDDKGANALANKLKRSAYPAYTEPLNTSRGTLWRVRVGPFASRDSAVEARDKLQGDGYNGIVTLTK